MAGTIRARVKGGMLEPLETLNLPEGKEVTVTILDVPSAGDMDAFRHSAGEWKGTIDALDRRDRPARWVDGAYEQPAAL